MYKYMGMVGTSISYASYISRLAALTPGLPSVSLSKLLCRDIPYPQSIVDHTTQHIGDYIDNPNILGSMIYYDHNYRRIPINQLV